MFGLRICDSKVVFWGRGFRFFKPPISSCLLVASVAGRGVGVKNCPVFFVGKASKLMKSTNCCRPKSSVENGNIFLVQNFHSNFWGHLLILDFCWEIGDGVDLYLENGHVMGKTTILLMTLATYLELPPQSLLFS